MAEQDGDGTPPGERPLPSTYYEARDTGLDDAEPFLARLAVHESAHAVVGELLGWPSQGIVLYPNVVTAPGRPRPVGHAYAESPLRGVDPEEPGYREGTLRRIQVLLAGSLAEALHFGDEIATDGGDALAIERLLATLGVMDEESRTLLRRCETGTGNLLAEGRVARKVARVADALVRCGRLTGDEVRRLMEDDG